MKPSYLHTWMFFPERERVKKDFSELRTKAKRTSDLERILGNIVYSKTQITEQNITELYPERKHHIDAWLGYLHFEAGETMLAINKRKEKDKNISYAKTKGGIAKEFENSFKYYKRTVGSYKHYPEKKEHLFNTIKAGLRTIETNMYNHNTLMNYSRQLIPIQKKTFRLLKKEKDFEGLEQYFNIISDIRNKGIHIPSKHANKYYNSIVKPLRRLLDATNDTTT